ncbi:MAG: F0F1 ATP synthase subunit epsilon [Bryobacterales bacterium]|nr:F0F1 ATP synthase subunit epsilon [Bryobacterales bacterium]
MAATFELEIATPEKLLISDTVSEAQIPGREGYLGILPGHAALLSELGVGLLTYTAGGRPYHLAVHGGFVEVTPDKVRVLADAGEVAGFIDTTRAEEALKRAHERLASPKENLDVVRALRALHRAEARLQAARLAAGKSPLE